MKNIQYQQKAVSELVEKTIGLLSLSGNRHTLIFKVVCVRADHCQIEKHFYAFLPVILADYSILCLIMQSEERIYRLFFSCRKNF